MNVDIFGPYKTVISLKTNNQVSVGGIKDGNAWEKHGEWKVISGKLILFLPDDSMPSFIFRKAGKIYIFDPWAKNMMAELQRLALVLSGGLFGCSTTSNRLAATYSPAQLQIHAEEMFRKIAQQVPELGSTGIDTGTSSSSEV